LTLEQSEKLLEGEDVPDSDPDDVRELLNYRGAFDLVADYMAADSTEGQPPVTEGLVREIHRRLVDGVRGGSANPGEYRKLQNYVARAVTGEIVYTPPPPQDVPILMREMVEWLNHPGDVHPVLVSGIAQFQLVHIHPFVDGNGRTSRLLSTLCLYRSGYDFKRIFTISEYYDRNRPEFYAAIQGVRKNDMDMTGWLEYFTVALATQMREVTQLGRQAIQKDIIVRENNLNERQAVAVGEILERGRITITDLERLCPTASRRTLQRDLKQLAEKGLCTETASTVTDPTKFYVMKNN
jgi:Fic family protein